MITDCTQSSSVLIAMSRPGLLCPGIRGTILGNTCSNKEHYRFRLIRIFEYPQRATPFEEIFEPECLRSTTRTVLPYTQNSCYDGRSKALADCRIFS